MMKKRIGKTRATLSQIRKMKGHSDFAKLIEEQKQERSKSDSNKP